MLHQLWLVKQFELLSYSSHILYQLGKMLNRQTRQFLDDLKFVNEQNNIVKNRERNLGFLNISQTITLEIA
jgi:hypothetical protein